MQERNTGMQSWTGIRGKNYTIVRNNKVSTWWHPSSSAKLSSGNLGSWGEVMTAMLWCLMSSEVKLGTGVTREVWQDSELAEISQQCHVSVMKHNNDSAIFDCEAEHIVCGVPMSDHITREDMWLELEIFAIMTPCREGNSCHSYNCKRKVVKILDMNH